MRGIYRPRHPERTVLYRVLFHNFDRFLTVYENCFEKEYGHLRPVVREVVERYFDCGNPRSGFARILSPGGIRDFRSTVINSSPGSHPNPPIYDEEVIRRRMGKPGISFFL